MHAATQSQQPWIMSQQALSPLVQVTQQPSFVISTLHAPIVMLQQHTVMPFIMQHMLHMPLAAGGRSRPPATWVRIIATTRPAYHHSGRDSYCVSIR